MQPTTGVKKTRIVTIPQIVPFQLGL